MSSRTTNANCRNCCRRASSRDCGLLAQHGRDYDLPSQSARTAVTTTMALTPP
jgi:hypothetical protein